MLVVVTDAASIASCCLLYPCYNQSSVCVEMSTCDSGRTNPFIIDVVAN